ARDLWPDLRELRRADERASVGRAGQPLHHVERPLQCTAVAFEPVHGRYRYTAALERAVQLELEVVVALEQAGRRIASQDQLLLDRRPVRAPACIERPRLPRRAARYPRDV